MDTDNKNGTPLVLAAARGHTTIMALLLKEDVRVHRRNQHIPLHEAVLHGQVESMRMLIDYGAKINKFNHAGYTSTRRGNAPPMKVRPKART